MHPVRRMHPLLALMAWPILMGPAHALSCDEILNMVSVGVPTAIVAQTIDDSGGLFEPTDLACLEAGGAPPEVMAAARALLPRENSTVTPIPSEASTEGAMLGQRAEREARAPTIGLPEDVERAIKLHRAHKPLSASLLIHDLLAEDRHPEQRSRLNYYLARCLQDLELPTLAQHHHLEVIRQGPEDPLFEHALLRLATLAEQSGDTQALARIATRLPPASWPARIRPALAYQAGLREHARGELGGALSVLSQVPTTSPHGLQARYVEGIILNEQGRLKSAVRAFREVIAEDARAASREEARRIRDLQNLAMLDVARIHYAVERFEDAERYYGMVEKRSTWWPRARLELAWTQFMLGDNNAALGQILTVRSPFFADEPFLPEAEVLRALNHYVLCEFNEAERVLLDMEGRLRPIHDELRSFAKRYASAERRKLADQAWQTYFTDFPAESDLPPEVFTELLRNRDLAAMAQRIERIEGERERLLAQKARWRDAVGEPMLEILEREQLVSQRRAGLLLLAESAKLATELGDLLTQSELIRFEANEARRIGLEDLAANPQLELPVDDTPIDYALSMRDLYWPFNGEFWEDELGGYVYTGGSTCR